MRPVWTEGRNGMGSETCSIAGCARRLEAVGLCRTHRKRRAMGEDMHAPIKERDGLQGCLVTECKRSHYAQGYCNPHYQQRQAGRVPAGIREPVENGTTRVYGSGYVSQKRDGRWVYQHKIRMEEHLGRPLLRTEAVHHRNGIRDDNRLKNLELWSSWHPSGQRVADKVAWAKELLAFYDPEALK